MSDSTTLVAATAEATVIVVDGEHLTIRYAGDLISLTGVGPPGPQGPPGAAGAPGAPGLGVPAGGSTRQTLMKVSATDNDTAWRDAGPNLFNVKHFGATGDGTTDDGAAIQAAITAMAPSGGTLYFPPGDYRYATTLDLTGLQASIVHGAGGNGQNTIIPSSRLVYTGTGARALDVRASRGIEFRNIGLLHTSASFTGIILDFTGTATANGSRHSLSNVLIGSTTGASVMTATGVSVDGCYAIELQDVGLVGLATGVQGQVRTADGGQNFSNGVRFTGGYGAQISGYHVTGAGYGWSITGYTAEPRVDGTPNFLNVPTNVVAPAVTLTGCHFDDSTAAGAWITMGGGSLCIQGGYFRIGAGSVVRLVAAIDALIFNGVTVASVAGQGGSALDGGGFTSAALHIGPNRYVAVDTPVKNLVATAAMVHTPTAVSLPPATGTTALFSSYMAAPLFNVGTDTGGPNTLTSDASSFEAGQSPWSNSTNGTTARSNLQAMHGTWSLAITATANGNAAASVAVANGFAVTGSTQYTFMAHYRAAATPRSVRVEIFWYDASNVAVGSSTVGSAVTDSTTGWTQAIASAISPPTAAKVVPVLRILSAAAAEVHYVDQVSLATGTSLTWYPAGTGPIYALLKSGTGTPEGSFAAPVASIYERTDGPPALYVKNSGGAATGWVPIATGPPTVVKTTTPTAADYGLAAIPVDAIWIQKP